MSIYESIVFVLGGLSMVLFPSRWQRLYSTWSLTSGERRFWARQKPRVFQIMGVLFMLLWLLIQVEHQVPQH